VSPSKQEAGAHALYIHDVILSKAGIQFGFDAEFAAWNWIPAFAGMTLWMGHPRDHLQVFSAGSSPLPHAGEGGA
jgi:hypothetical protein